MSPARHLVVATVCGFAGLADVAALASVTPLWLGPSEPRPLPSRLVAAPPVFAIVEKAPPVVVAVVSPPEPAAPASPVVAAVEEAPAEPSGPLLVVPFASESLELSAEARASLVAVVAARQGRSLRVEGHADPSGRPEGNDYFARERARRVARELERLGVPRTSLEVFGFGSSRPVDVAHTPEAHARNRRVEVWGAVGGS